MYVHVSENILRICINLNILSHMKYQTQIIGLNIVAITIDYIYIYITQKHIHIYIL